ncbi:MAG: ATP-grasp domain-containing protein [Crocinitomicaceae bacterium]
MIDFTILTDRRWVNPQEVNDYTANVLLEDRLLLEALEKKGFNVKRKSWDDPAFDWASTKYVIFRTTWDYFERFPEFSAWLKEAQTKTKLINPRELILWNIDKHYLGDLDKKGIPIPPTVFIEKGDARTLAEICSSVNWEKFILKPVVSGAARHTYMMETVEIQKHEEVFRELINEEAMMLQEFQNKIFDKGEVSLMIFGGKYSHAVLKKAKQGDFRVQDDFGGTLHDYEPKKDVIKIAEACMSACPEQPLYARVDIMWDNSGNPVVGELEMIEPELWFRRDNQAADRLADAIAKYCQSPALS